MLRIPHKTDYKAFSFKSYSHIVVSLVRTYWRLKPFPNQLKLAYFIFILTKITKYNLQVYVDS